MLGGINRVDGPGGRSPTGVALKTEAIKVPQDFARDPDVLQGRDELLAESSDRASPFRCMCRHPSSQR